MFLDNQWADPVGVYFGLDLVFWVYPEAHLWPGSLGWAHGCWGEVMNFKNGLSLSPPELCHRFLHCHRAEEDRAGHSLYWSLLKLGELAWPPLAFPSVWFKFLG